MARALFKQTALTGIEDMGNAGSWKPILKLEKQQGQMTSCYVDKIRISFILEGDSASGGENLGFLFAVSNKETLSATDANNSEYVVSAGASRGGGGVVTLPVKRRIVFNDYDQESGENALNLQARMTDTGSNSYDVTFIVEVWGRWHQTVAIA